MRSSRAVSSSELVAELAARAPALGGNPGAWPGLTIYRFTEPTGPTWEEIESLSLCIVAQGRKAVTADGRTFVYDPSHYLVLGSNLSFQATILQASPAQPFLSFVLQIDPAVVRRVSASMRESESPPSPPVPERPPGHQSFVSVLDQPLLDSVLRFLAAIGTEADRRVLAPIYQQEMVYRVLQREQFARFLALAANQTATNPLAPALAYVRTNLAQPMTVADMAAQVNLSPSAFAHQFREVTGKAPYQFLKELRLDRARELLIDDTLPVAAVSRQVGYASSSHFTAAFRRRFGMTPRAYQDAQRRPAVVGAGDEPARGRATPSLSR